MKEDLKNNMPKPRTGFIVVWVAAVALSLLVEISSKPTRIVVVTLSAYSLIWFINYVVSLRSVDRLLKANAAEKKNNDSVSKLYVDLLFGNNMYDHELNKKIIVEANPEAAANLGYVAPVESDLEIIMEEQP